MGMPKMWFIFYFIFLVLSFANFIRNLLGYYHTIPLHICALCSWIPAKLHDRHRSILHQSFLRTKHTHTHTHNSVFITIILSLWETIVITHSEKYLDEFGGHLIFINISSTKEEEYYTYSLTLKRLGERFWFRIKHP